MSPLLSHVMIRVSSMFGSIGVHIVALKSVAIGMENLKTEHLRVFITSGLLMLLATVLGCHFVKGTKGKVVFQKTSSRVIGPCKN